MGNSAIIDIEGLMCEVWTLLLCLLQFRKLHKLHFLLTGKYKASLDVQRDAVISSYDLKRLCYHFRGIFICHVANH